MSPPLNPNASVLSMFSALPSVSPSYSTPSSSLSPSSFPLFPSVFMVIGTLSNALGLWILARAYSRSRRLRRSRAQFLLLASGLLVTDLAGHLITGAFVVTLYVYGALPMGGCQFLGGCMVFFGLSPLLLGFLMACERCLGLTRPLWHSAIVTQTRARISLALAWAIALLVSNLPLLGYGKYKMQSSGTWCFLEEPPGFCLLYSGLGLGCLVSALVCNVVVGSTLLRARLLRSSGVDLRRRQQRACSHDLEMMVQLLGVTLVSCVCWSPLLVSLVMLQAGIPLPRPNWLLFSVRLASLNQILDPWVYILLRRAVLRRLCSIFVRVARVRGGKPIRWDPEDFQSSDRSQISRL